MNPCLLAALALTAVGCGKTEPKVPGAEQRTAKQKLADARRVKQACGSAQTYDRLKALTFDEVGKLRSGASVALDSLQGSATLRMEQPRATSRDETLDITACEGHLILDLPPGLQASDGSRRLEADVRYSAQQAADGSGLVYEMQGAEPVIRGLAALALPGGARGVLVATPAPMALPAPVSAPAAAPAPAPAPAAQRQVAAASPPQAPRESPTAPRAGRTPAPRDVQRGSEAARPSFDCRNVSSRVLRMVCSDPALAGQDRRMSSAFYAALADGDEPTRAALRESRDRFLRFRNRCGTAACVSQAYNDRMAEIRDIARGE